MYQIEIYEDKNGKSEIKEYLKLLHNSHSKENNIKYRKISQYMRLLSKYGLKLNSTYIKHISDEIWELRPIRDRVLFAKHHNSKFILLCFFMKKTSKTPRKEIRKAKRLYKDYVERSDSNE